MIMQRGSLSGVICAIVGGGGFLGANLAMALKARGAEVRAFGRTRYFDEPLEEVQWMQGALDDLQKLSIFLSGVDVVFHLAGTSTPASAEFDRIGDVKGSISGHYPPSGFVPKPQCEPDSFRLIRRDGLW